MDVKAWMSRLARHAGLDFHIVLTLASRLWTVLAGVVMIFGLPHWLSGAEQGFYFTFYSLIGLQVFFEMGLNYVVIQFVGHEMAHLHFDEAGKLAGPSQHLDRLASLVGLLRRWYLRMSLAYGAGVALAGVYFFSRNHELATSAWLGPWLLLVGLTAGNLFVSPFLSVAEGSGHVGQVARQRLLASMVGNLAMWLLLANGAGLWAVPCTQLCTVVGAHAWLKRRARYIGALAGQACSVENRVSWRREIFPFQWRIALSWISGYFIFQLFNPILFSRQGALEAGKAGLALTIFGTLLTVSMSWINAKAPVIAGMLARQEREPARRLFRGMMLRSAAFNFSGCVAVLCGAWLLQALNLSLATRLPGLLALACIALATLANHLVAAMAVFMRAHKEDPLMRSSVGMAVLSIGGIYFAAGYGLDVVMATYAALSVVVGLPWCFLYFRRYWRALSLNSPRRTA